MKSRFSVVRILVAFLFFALLGRGFAPAGAEDTPVPRAQSDTAVIRRTAMADPSRAAAHAAEEEPNAGSFLPGLSIQEVAAPKSLGYGLRIALALDGAGRPHVAYGGDHLYYTWHDDTTWHRETVDGTYGVGEGASLALDAAGRPHISYYDSLQQDLRYAYNDGTGWQLTTVDGQDNAGEYSSLALDGAGLPHISYSYCRGWTPETGCVYGELRYARFNGTRWITTTVDSGHADYENSLALDKAGLPCIGYLDHSTIKYAHHDGTSWNLEEVVTFYSPSRNVSLALDSLGRPYIAYSSNYFWNHYLAYAHYDGMAWQFGHVGSDVFTADFFLALDMADHPRISYSNGDNGELQYAIYDGMAWSIETVLPESSRYYFAGTALALDAAGRPHIAVRQANGVVVTSDIAVVTYDGATWHSEVVDHGGQAGRSNSLILDAAGRPHIAYVESHDTLSLEYATYDGSAWQSTTVDADLGDGGGHISLALDSLGQPHISYHVASITGTAEVRYASYDGSAWQTETVAPGWAGYTSLALDAANQPHISYYSYADYGLKYASYDGSVWHIETVCGNGRFTSLALDAYGRPHISFSNGASLWYAYHDGTAWVVANLGGTGATDTSLALDASGQPHIAYYGRMSSPVQRGFLNYAYRDGATWHTATVEPNQGYYLGNDEDQVDISLAVDSAGRPHITYCSYRDGSGCDDLRYAVLDGASWYTQTVDSVGYVGNSTSLALDASGQPHISYHTLWPGQYLKYAFLDCAPVETLELAGPDRLPMGVYGFFTATYTPPTATAPLITWSDGTVGPTLRHSWPATGTQVLTATGISACSRVQGALTVTVFCQAPTGAAVSGPFSLLVDQAGAFQVTPVPITASLPISWTWDNGTVGASASYSWTATGTYTLTVTGINACGQGQGEFPVCVLQEWPYEIYLPLITEHE